MTIRNGRLKRGSERGRMPEEKAFLYRAVKPSSKPRDNDAQGRRIYRAFTLRFPTPLYERLLRESVADERSVTAQMQVYLEQMYAEKDARS